MYDTILQEDHQTTDSDKVVHVSVYYDAAKADYVTSTPRVRGYYMLVVPQRRERGCRITAAYTGYRALVFACPKRTQAAAQKALESARCSLPQVIVRVLEENQLQLRVEDPTLSA